MPGHRKHWLLLATTLVGAGLFGFLINPPVALYYMQGLNTTPVHAHTEAVEPLAYAFWAMNGGLALMVLLSLLPIGLAQTWASVEYGMWFARSAEFLQQPILQTLRWMRIVGDTVFLSGVAALIWFFFGLLTGRSYARTTFPLSDLGPSLDWLDDESSAREEVMS